MLYRLPCSARSLLLIKMTIDFSGSKIFVCKNLSYYFTWAYEEHSEDNIERLSVIQLIDL